MTKQKFPTTDKLVPEMVSIPGGNFLMGSPEGGYGPHIRLRDRDMDLLSFHVLGYEDERPPHKVTVHPFFMGKYPITQAEYQAVMGENPSHFQFKGDRRPVECVTWYDAIEFCARLSELTGKTYRLPSEAEWEYACRTGTTTQFSFGDDKSQLGHYAWFDGSQTHPVGQKKPNAFGLYDMHGNVWEWCEDTEHENHRVLRGGSWYNNPVNCRSAYRFRYYPDYSYYYIGLRVVCG